VTTLTFATIHNDVIMNWQQCSSKEKQRNPQGLDTKKLSNIQLKDKDPVFQQQHQGSSRLLMGIKGN